ncbi:hypothetical protein ACQPUY_15080 [Clostridium nigeriense]|uniref:hypothetical protein n=1 Tax=Clostridium nigeriense TaxID=1805470 RepID=UPI003D356EB6
MKKVTKTLLFSICILFLCVATTFALPSISINGAIVEDVLVDGKKVDGVTIKFVDEISNVDSLTKSVIEKLNSGINISEALNGNEVLSKDNLNLNDFKMLTKLQDLVAYDSQGKSLTNVTVTWEVTNLIEDLGDIYVLHYSTVRNVWEIITPTNVDFDKKTITAEFEDLSPVAVIYKYNNSITTGGDVNNEATTNKFDYKTLGYIGTAVVLLVIIFAICNGNKKGNNRKFDSLSK